MTIKVQFQNWTEIDSLLLWLRVSLTCFHEILQAVDKFWQTIISNYVVNEITIPIKQTLIKFKTECHPRCIYKIKQHNCIHTALLVGQFTSNPSFVLFPTKHASCKTKLAKWTTTSISKENFVTHWLLVFSPILKIPLLSSTKNFRNSQARKI